MRRFELIRVEINVPINIILLLLRSSIGGVAYVTVFLIPPPLGQPNSVFGGTDARWLFSCFHNPPNSDGDYRIFNVRTRSFVCVRIHTGVGHTDIESAQQF